MHLKKIATSFALGNALPLGQTDLLRMKQVNMVLIIHRNRKTYEGRGEGGKGVWRWGEGGMEVGEGGMEVGGRGRIYTYR